MNERRDQVASGPRNNEESTEIQSIGELIRAERVRSGLSYRDLSARAEAAGLSVKFQYLNDLANSGPKSWPKNPDTFRALSIALQLSVRTIVLSYAVSLGLDVGGAESRITAGLPDNVDSLSPELTDALLSLIRTLSDGKNRSSRARSDADELSLAADSSKNQGKAVNQSLASLGESTQEPRRKR